MYSLTGYKARRQSRRVRPRAEPACQPKKQQLPHTSSTSVSSEGSDFRASDARVQELQRRLCPVTGILRDVSADYRILPTQLGRGHYGVVRECVHRATRRTLAVKSVDKSKVSRLDHLRREVYLLHKADHSGILRMIDCCEDAEFVHIVTGENARPDGCLSEARAARVMKSLLEAVAYLHANDIVHRDIKPENVLLESSREDSAVKLIDFGLSRRHGRGEGPMTTPVGTAYYMAPELLGGRYDKACDVWSLGTIAYIMLCGYPPFNGETDPDIFEAIRRGQWRFPSPAWSDKSDEALDFVRCLMTRDPVRRPTAREALDHPWIRNNVVSSDARDVQDLYSRIQTLRMTINRFKRSQQQH